MENNYLSHYGIRGMKWGVRRFQNSDGSLTSAGKSRYSSRFFGKLKRKGKGEEDQEETTEQKRSRLLKSTDANDIYKNRSLLTTQELKERIDRIDTERRLSEIADKSKKTGMDYVDKALKIGRKVNEVYEFTNTPLMKAVRKEVFGEEVSAAPSLASVYKNRATTSTKDLQDALRRANTEKSIRNLLEEEAKAKREREEKKKKK